MAAVLVFLDNKNLISNSIYTLPGSVLNVIFILSGVLIFLFIMKYRIFKSILSPLVNRVDFFIVFSFSTLILFRVTAFLQYSKVTKNTDYVEIFISLLGIVLLIRDINVGKELRKKESTVIDLKQILDNK
ncbi:MAG: hypothetical protein LIR10_07325, partial [Bacillota bacterium]|nr:hypothetical protein [Bacillota bacterium]